MELNPIAKELNIAYQPHPVAPLAGRTGLVAVLDGETSVRRVLLMAGIDPHQPITIQLDGEMLTVEEWDSVYPNEGQLLSVHATVQGGGGGGSNVLQIIATIAIVAISVALAASTAGILGVAIAGSLTVGMVAGAVVSVAGSLIIGAIFAPKPPAMPNAPAAVSPTYSLSGGQNRARPYEPMPFVMGTHRLFLDYASRPYTEYQGNDQYLYQIFNLSLGNITASDYKIGTTPIDSYSDYEFVTADTNGRLLAFPGNVDSSAGAVLTKAGGAVSRNTSVDTEQIGIDLEASLFFAADNGTLQNRSVEILIEIRNLASGGFFSPALTVYGDNANYNLSNGVLTITGNSQRPIRITLLTRVTVSQYEVKITRLTDDSTNSREQTQTNWSVLRSYQLDDTDYKGQNRVGLIIKATEQLNGAVQTLSANIVAQATYWNGTAWVTGVTSNPAHWFMHFARGVYNSDNKLMYGIGLTDSQIDLASLVVWANFCATESLTFNGVIDSTLTAADVLTMLGTVGLGSPSWASGKLGVIFDSRNASPVMAFGMSNIIRDSFEVAYISENLAEEIVVRFSNVDKDYEQEEVRVLAPDVVTPARTSAIDLFGCTNETMAGKFANYIAAQQYYRRRRVTWQSDFEGFVCQRGDVVLLSHDLTQWGYSGRFVNVNGNIVTLDRSVPRQNQIEYLMLVRPDGTTTTYDVAATTDEESDTLTIINDVITFQNGTNLIDHRWTFSPLETPGKKLKILSVQPASDSRLQIVATDESAEFYDAWDGTFVAPPVDTVLPAIAVAVNNLTISNRVAFVNGYLTNRVAIAWGVTGSVLYSRVNIYLDGNLIQQIPEALIPFAELDIGGGGSVFVEVTPYGLTGAGLTQTTTLALSALDFPAPPDTVTLVSGEGDRAATFEWTPVLGVQSYVIEVVVAGAVKRSVNIGNTLSYTYTLETAQADGGPFRAYTFRVYSVNQTGQSTTFTSAEFNNPQIGQLSNVSLTPMPLSLILRYTTPNDADFSGVQVWISTDTNFAPDNSFLLYDGQEDYISIESDASGVPLERGTTYFIYVAGYDTFGKDNLTLSGKLNSQITSVPWESIESLVTEEVISAGLNARIDLIDTTGDADFPLGLIEGLRDTNTATNILDNQVDDLGVKLLESALKVQENTDLLYDAGVTVDSTTGEVYIFAVRENTNELNEVGIRLDAAEANITLRATTVYVDDAIATAVIDPSQIAELGDLQARIAEAEIEIDGLDAAITLKADLTVVNSQGARLTSAEVDIDALEGQIVLKADNIELENTTARVTTVETELNALDVASITQSVTDVKFVERAQNQIAETQLRDILTGEANYDNLDRGIATASTDLRAYTDGQLIAEATARLQLAADLGNTSAALEQESIARATADGALSSQVTTLQSTVGENTTAVQVTSETVDGIQGKYAVKIDNNGFVTGYGLISEPNNGVPTSSFFVLADKFAIASPTSTDPTGDLSVPFFVLTSPQIIDGKSFDAGVYIKKGNISTIDADSITTGFIDASVIESGSITAQKIDSRGLTIKDNFGNIIFGSGTNLDWSLVSNQPADIFNNNISISPDGTLVGAGGGSVSLSGLGAGAFATLSTLTKQNIGTYIASAAIGTALIENLAVTNALIANLAVTNAKIADLDAGKINAGFISSDRIETGSFDAKIATITNAQITTLDAGKINTGTLSADRIAAGSIDAKLLNVNAAVIIDGTISTAKIGVAQIDTLRVANNAVTLQASFSRANAGVGSFVINSTTGGQLLIIGNVFEASIANALLTINGVGVVQGTDVIIDDAGTLGTSSATSMFLINIGAGSTTISASSNRSGFVLTGLLTQR